MLSVEDIMTPRPELATLGPDDRISGAWELMARRRVRHLPVLDGAGRLVGLVSHRDLLAAGAPGAASGCPTDARLADIMTREVVTVHPEANVRHAGLKLRRLNIGCLPVVRGRKLLGIVTDSDFVWVALHVLEQLEDAEPVTAE